MAIYSEFDFTAANGTSGASIPRIVGPALAGFGLGTPTVQSNALDFASPTQASADIGSSTFGACTIKATVLTSTTGYVQLAFASSAANFGGNYYYVECGSAGVRLTRNEVQQGSTITAGITTNDTVELWIARSSGGRIRVFIDGSTTAALDYTDGSPLADGLFALYGPSTARLDYLQIQDVETLPGGGAVLAATPSVAVTVSADLTVTEQARQRAQVLFVAPKLRGGSAAWRDPGTRSILRETVWRKLASGLGSTPSIAVTVAPALSVPKPLQVSLGISASISANLSVPKPLAAAPSVVVSAAAALSVPKQLQAALSVPVTVAADLSVAKPLAAALPVSATVSASLTVDKPLAAALSVPVLVSSDMSIPKPLAVALPMAVTVAPDLSAGAAGAALAAAVIVTGAVAADLNVPKPLQASLSVPVTLAGDIAVPKPLNVALPVAVTVAPAINVPKPLEAAVNATVSVAPLLNVPKPLSTSLTVPVTVAADLDVPGTGAALSASLGVPVTVTAAVSVPKPLQVTLPVSATVVGDLTTRAPIAAALPVSVTVGPAVNIPKPLSAAVNVTVAAQGTLSGLSAALAVGLPITVTISPTLGGGGVTRLIEGVRAVVYGGTAYRSRVAVAAASRAYIRTESAVRAKPKFTGGG